MTCEVVIMNHHGVAMAADSAEIDRETNTVKTGVHKMFRLTSSANIGILVSGNRCLMEKPWEDIIVNFDKNGLKGVIFPTLKEYCGYFIRYMEKLPFNSSKQDNSDIFIIGYGKKDKYPIFYHYQVQGVLHNILQYKDVTPKKNAMYSEDSAGIILLAINGECRTIINGISLPLDAMIRTKIKEIGNNCIIEQFMKEYDSMIEERNRAQRKCVARMNKLQMLAFAKYLVEHEIYSRELTNGSTEVSGQVKCGYISDCEIFIE